MNSSRRDFIRQTALLGAGAALPLRFLHAQPANRALVG
ncbi:MAG: twin-arginine translocation signal domain-containing protein, partial [Chitinophagaceae bacterium]|nr:twin-arginine translocation signal domain-containing protein [Chitinophagaceae bacterium]